MENHAGYKVVVPGSPPAPPAFKQGIVNPYALADHIKQRTQQPDGNNPYTFYGRFHPGAKRLKAREFLVTPLELDELTLKVAKKLGKNAIGHNEVTALGRSGVRLYENMPPTGLIKVKGIYVVKALMPPRSNYNEYIDLAYKMSAVNNNVPILFIEDNTQ